MAQKPVAKAENAAAKTEKAVAKAEKAVAKAERLLPRHRAFLQRHKRLYRGYRAACTEATLYNKGKLPSALPQRSHSGSTPGPIGAAPRAHAQGGARPKIMKMAVFGVF